MQFSERFKQLCKERHITQKKALADMGFHRNAAQRWGDGSPSTEAVVKIAAYFEVTTDFLLDNVDNKKTPTVSGERNYEDERILEALDKADPATREAILLLLKLR